MDFAGRFAVIRIRIISPLHFLRHYLEWKISKDIQYIRFYNDIFIIHLYVYNFTDYLRNLIKKFKNLKESFSKINLLSFLQSILFFLNEM